MENIDITVPAGAVVPFYNVALGGTGNRNPIFWGTTQADAGWILCDGGSDGSGGTTPNLVGKFVKGSLPKDAGATGGSATIEIQDLAVNGTIGGTALTVAQLPAHTHTGSANSAGNHAHTRGTMNITGSFWGENECYGASGAFTKAAPVTPTKQKETMAIKMILVLTPLKLGPDKLRLMELIPIPFRLGIPAAVKPTRTR